jgi:Nucleotidyl transferase AbiEii toxin, Type IV TA system
MPLDELHRRVAAIALQAAAGYGFALGGGNALIQHGVISRPTQDVDLFTDHETGVRAAAGAVEGALREAGFQAERQDQTGGLGEIFPDIGEGLAEWIITAPGGEQMALQMAYFDRAREPVITDVGPVLDLEDVVGGKVCALASRGYERDYLDTAAALERYSPAELIGFARRLDPGLEGQDFAEAGQRLDQMPDYAFTSFGLTQPDVARLRERFAAWPRDPEAAAADIADDPGGHLSQAGRHAAGAPEAAAGQPPGRRDVRQAEPDEPEIEP